MRGKKKTGELVAGILCLCMLLLAGCGQAKEPEAVTAPAIAVSDKGVVTAYLVSKFDKSYYDISGLSKKAMEEAAAYNSENKTENGEALVSVEAVEETGTGENRLAIVTMKFRDAAVYSEYLDSKLFYGTVAQAQEEGYDFGPELVSVKDQSVIGEKEIREMGKRHILIVEDKVRVFCPGKVMYLSSGAVLNADGTVDASQSEGAAYIIMK